MAEPRMARTILGILAASCAVAAAVWVVTTGASDRDRSHWESRCAAVQARPVPTGGGHWLCVTPDGRVVDNG